MSYSQTFFSKDLYDLEYDDIVQFFNEEKEETLSLEFKSYPSQGNHSDKENAVFKAICGLLNSEGGIVIWGAPVETRDVQGNTSAAGVLTPFDTPLDRDRLVNKISSLIIPLATGIRVQKLDAPSGYSIFIIEIEKSNQKPHQFKNNYHIRLDGQTKIAPHYLIEAMMKSINFPLIRGHIRLKQIETDGHNYILYLRKLIYNSSKYINDLNLTYTIIAGPGVIIINDGRYNGFYDNSEEIISHGRPISGDFRLVVPSRLLTQNNNEVMVTLNFVGEKSPSRMSIYKYSISSPSLGDVADENIYILEKRENELSTDANNASDDDKINSILDS
ncbi:helix-turn-helix domain-containing protein [Aquimarina sp. AU474]|uniref:AlbA family DNA-binding domain-containing protein n=1 Tax=Aquimarina sp. AU474 TaxID=2108529 RepID=UPI000D6981D5|nr:ATP-binding protein [Aquimarina sp. AU474]